MGNSSSSKASEPINFDRDLLISEPGRLSFRSRSAAARVPSSAPVPSLRIPSVQDDTGTMPMPMPRPRSGLLGVGATMPGQTAGHRRSRSADPRAIPDGPPPPYSRTAPSPQPGSSPQPEGGVLSAPPELGRTFVSEPGASTHPHVSFSKSQPQSIDKPLPPIAEPSQPATSSPSSSYRASPRPSTSASPLYRSASSRASSSRNSSTSSSASTALGSSHTRVFDPLHPLPLDKVAQPVISPPRKVRKSNSYLRAPLRRESAEDALTTLSRYDTVVIVDDSQSMTGPLWREARDALAALAQTAGEYHTHGFDVHFLNDKRIGRGLKTPEAVYQLFSKVKPQGVSLIGEKLEQLLLRYLAMLEAAHDSGDPAVLKAVKPVNFIIITDGTPTDDPEVVIVNAARRLDAGSFPITQVGIQFVQIGNSAKATEFLDELDNGLASTHGVRDIVDTTPYTGGALTAELLTKILLGGINRRVDRKGAQAVMS